MTKSSNTNMSRSRSVAHTKARNKVSKNFESNSHSNWFQPASEASLMTEQNQQRGPQQNCFTSQIYFLLMTPTFTKLHTVYRLNQSRFFPPTWQCLKSHMVSEQEVKLLPVFYAVQKSGCLFKSFQTVWTMSEL